mgnify:FL=1
MAEHVAKQVLGAVVTVCTGLLTTGSNVFRSRVHTMTESKLPALLIYAREDVMEEEATSMQTNGKKAQLYLLTVSIDAIVKSASETTAEDSLFTIRKEVQAALESDLTLSGKAKDLWLSEATVEDRTGAGDSPVLGMSMLWIIRYRIKQGAPDVVLN